ncbi:hypothetical protein P152DRAFT_381628, partial [Eremomyces bilateralis CBS 781.70]
EGVELEAVVSCTSDGLVVILRRARPLIPGVKPPTPRAPGVIHMRTEPSSGIFAAPWAPHPVFSPSNVNPPPTPQFTGVPATNLTAGGPPPQDFFTAIRDIACFAWALTGINGCLAEFSQGKPQGESQPPEGLPVW